MTRVETLKQSLLYLALGAWALLCVTGGAWLMATHLVSLPAPPTGLASAELASALGRLRPTDLPARYLAVHVLYADCGCSRRIEARLLERGRRRELDEVVLLAVAEASTAGANRDEEDEVARHARALRARGFVVAVLEPSSLARAYGIEAAPLLVVLTPDDEIAYSGGYTQRKQAADVREGQILDAAVEGGRPEPLPVFGCATSARLKDALDPFRLKEIAR